MTQPSKLPTKQEILEWLDSLQANYQWLADQLCVSQSAVNQWFAPKTERKIPTTTLLLIQRMMVDTQIDEDEDILFTFEEAKTVGEYMRQIGTDNFPDFARMAILTYIEQNPPTE